MILIFKGKHFEVVYNGTHACLQIINKIIIRMWISHVIVFKTDIAIDVKYLIITSVYGLKFRTDLEQIQNKYLILI